MLRDEPVGGESEEDEGRAFREQRDSEDRLAGYIGDIKISKRGRALEISWAGGALYRCQGYFSKDNTWEEFMANGYPPSYVLTNLYTAKCISRPRWNTVDQSGVFWSSGPEGEEGAGADPTELVEVVGNGIVFHTTAFADDSVIVSVDHAQIKSVIDTIHTSITAMAMDISRRVSPLARVHNAELAGEVRSANESIRAMALMEHLNNRMASLSTRHDYVPTIELLTELAKEPLYGDSGVRGSINDSFVGLMRIPDRQQQIAEIEERVQGLFANHTHFPEDQVLMEGKLRARKFGTIVAQNLVYEFCPVFHHFEWYPLVCVFTQAEIKESIEKLRFAIRALVKLRTVRKGLNTKKSNALIHDKATRGSHKMPTLKDKIHMYQLCEVHQSVIEALEVIKDAFDILESQLQLLSAAVDIHFEAMDTASAVDFDESHMTFDDLVDLEMPGLEADTIGADAVGSTEEKYSIMVRVIFAHLAEARRVGHRVKSLVLPSDASQVNKDLGDLVNRYRKLLLCVDVDRGGWASRDRQGAVLLGMIFGEMTYLRAGYLEWPQGLDVCRHWNVFKRCPVCWPCGSFVKRVIDKVSGMFEEYHSAGLHCVLDISALNDSVLRMMFDAACSPDAVDRFPKIEDTDFTTPNAKRELEEASLAIEDQDEECGRAKRDNEYCRLYALSAQYCIDADGCPARYQLLDLGLTTKNLVGLPIEEVVRTLAPGDGTDYSKFSKRPCRLSQERYWFIYDDRLVRAEISPLKCYLVDASFLDVGGGQHIPYLTGPMADAMVLATEKYKDGLQQKAQQESSAEQRSLKTPPALEAVRPDVVQPRGELPNRPGSERAGSVNLFGPGKNRTHTDPLQIGEDLLQRRDKDALRQQETEALLRDALLAEQAERLAFQERDRKWRESLHGDLRAREAKRLEQLEDRARSLRPPGADWGQPLRKRTELAGMLGLEDAKKDLKFQFSDRKTAVELVLSNQLEEQRRHEAEREEEIQWRAISADRADQAEKRSQANLQMMFEKGFQTIAQAVESSGVKLSEVVKSIRTEPPNENSREKVMGEIEEKVAPVCFAPRGSDVPPFGSAESRDIQEAIGRSLRPLKPEPEPPLGNEETGSQPEDLPDDHVPDDDDRPPDMTPPLSTPSGAATPHFAGMLTDEGVAKLVLGLQEGLVRLASQPNQDNLARLVAARAADRVSVADQSSAIGSVDGKGIGDTYDFEGAQMRAEITAREQNLQMNQQKLDKERLEFEQLQRRSARSPPCDPPAAPAAGAVGRTTVNDDVVSVGSSAGHQYQTTQSRNQRERSAPAAIDRSVLATAGTRGFPGDLDSAAPADSTFCPPLYNLVTIQKWSPPQIPAKATWQLGDFLKQMQLSMIRLGMAKMGTQGHWDLIFREGFEEIVVAKLDYVFKPNRLVYEQYYGVVTTNSRWREVIENILPHFSNKEMKVTALEEQSKKVKFTGVDNAQLFLREADTYINLTKQVHQGKELVHHLRSAYQSIVEQLPHAAKSEIIREVIRRKREACGDSLTGVDKEWQKVVEWSDLAKIIRRECEVANAAKKLPKAEKGEDAKPLFGKGLNKKAKEWLGRIEGDSDVIQKAQAVILQLAGTGLSPDDLVRKVQDGPKGAWKGGPVGDKPYDDNFAKYDSWIDKYGAGYVIRIAGEKVAPEGINPISTLCKIQFTQKGEFHVTKAGKDGILSGRKWTVVAMDKSKLVPWNNAVDGIDWFVKFGIKGYHFSEWTKRGAKKGGKN